MNENENNKNREYPEIDKRIKDTYIEESTAQKTKLYDMYARFLRWASDRVDENGIVAFVSNSSFVDSRTFDGFRKVVAKEFNEIWVIDLKGNARTSGERRRREGGNVFDDQIRVGVAVYFLVKKKGVKGCRIFYDGVRDYAKTDEKREFLIAKKLPQRPFSEIHPDSDHNWLNVVETDFESLMPIADKAVKLSKPGAREKAIFKLFSLGIVTNRDEWLYDFSIDHLSGKVKYFCEQYTSEKARWNKSGRPTETGDFVDRSIKWTSELEAHMKRGTEIPFAPDECITESQYRPYVRKYTYFAPVLIHRPYQNFDLFPVGGASNPAMLFSAEERSEFGVIAFRIVPNKDMFMPSAGQVLAYRRRENGEWVDNITDWALDQFRKHYQPGRGKKDRPITKESIFHYVYAVLHDPAYREKYAINLKREFPRIPFYADFWQWADWGKALMDLHIGYESVEPWALKRSDVPDQKSRTTGMQPKAMLKADKEAGVITLDSETSLAAVPAEAWDYKLGNRSALEWILDQYKEKTPKDPTIRVKFNTYRFADYKEKVIELIARVTRVSVETQRIVGDIVRAKR